MTNRYIDWIANALDRNPRLTRAGLARHMKLHRSAVTQILKGRREIKATELDCIASYLGESPVAIMPQTIYLVPVGGGQPMPFELRSTAAH